MTLSQELMIVREHQATMKADLNWVKKEQIEQSKQLQSIDSKLGDFIEACNAKYADKKKLEELDKRTQKIDGTLQKWAAVIMFIVFVVTIVINILF